MIRQVWKTIRHPYLRFSKSRYSYFWLTALVTAAWVLNLTACIVKCNVYDTLFTGYEYVPMAFVALYFMHHFGTLRG
jgi:hypothetical protein